MNSFKYPGHLKIINHLYLSFIFFLICIFLLFVYDAEGQTTDTNKTENKRIDSTEYKTQTIEVNALRGVEELTPITYENIRREAIEKKQIMQDLPTFLSGSTNINAYSESGTSFGYSYFTIRGFDQRRISVLLNGTPQNDPEDHQVYWIELSDIMSSVESIQLQRGIGTVLYGTSGVGGIINVQTIDYFRNKFINVNAGYGNFNSKRYSLEYSSGITKNGFGFYGKFSKTKTDGYRKLAWSDHYSYFLSAGKLLNDKSSIKINFYGSPNKNHLTYEGVTKEYLDGKVTGDRLKDRRYNPLFANNETDNFYQPHYELIYNLQASKDIYISNTINYIRREGYITTNYSIDKGYTLSYYNLAPFYVNDSVSYNNSFYHKNYFNQIDSFPGKGYQIYRCDMVVNLHVNSDSYGWFPKMQWRHFNDKANLLLGGEFRLHNSEHYGEISYGNALPPGTPSDYKYYFYNGKKTTASVYLNEFTNVDKNLSIMAGVQFTYHRYKIDNDAFRHFDFGADYKFLTSRVGFNYNITDNFKSYSSLCIARREPRLKDIYDADSPLARLNLKIVDTVNHIYSTPLVQYEELTDYEFGFGYTSSFLRANLNFYVMDYKNEIISSGMLNSVGEPVYGNAGQTIHRGVEFEFELNLLSGLVKKIKSSGTNLTLSGNISLSDNYFKEYIEIKGVDTLGNIIKGNDYSGNQILLTPRIIGNISLNLNTDFGLGAYIAMQYIGKQYLDNTQNEEKTPYKKLVPGYVDKDIKPYAVMNIGLVLDIVPLMRSNTFNKYFRSIEASLRINNVLDRLYETYGMIDADGMPRWIPAADRNAFLNLKIGF